MDHVSMAYGISGILLTFFGRRLFWLFLACVGFFFGFTLADSLLANGSFWILLAIAVVAGIVGALLAIFLQRAALGIAGFLVGGLLAKDFVIYVFETTTQIGWIAFLVGGMLGALVMAVVFEWALIVFSSLIGAMWISQVHIIPPSVQPIVFLVFGALGIFYQAKSHLKQKH